MLSPVTSRTLLARLLPVTAVALLAAAYAIDTTYTNGIYSVTFADNGNWSAKTGANHPSPAKLLTFNGGGRALLWSRTTSTTYALGDLNMAGTKPTVTTLPSGVRAGYHVGTGTDDLHVDQDVTATGTTVNNSAVLVVLKVRNDGSAPVMIGARQAVDFKLADDDGPGFTPDGAAELTAATRFTSPSFNSFSLTDNNQGNNYSVQTAPTLRTTWTAAVAGVGTTPPDILELADYGVKAAVRFVPALPLANTKINRDNEARS